MSIEKTLGGDRVGTGNKMKMHLHGYGRSTHDLGKVVRTTMTSGTVVPIYVEFVEKGDVWEIDLDSLIKTHPLNGPLFGSLKLQLDCYTADVRLYNKQLHNNITGLGLNMDQVIFPVMRLNGKNPEKNGGELNQQQISPDSLLSYLGIRGLGTRTEGLGNDKGRVEIERNAIPLLMYWDIMKNYYSNKQEEKGYVIGKGIEEDTPPTLLDAIIYHTDGTIEYMAKLNTQVPSVTANSRAYYVEPGASIQLRGRNLRKKQFQIFVGSYDSTTTRLRYIDNVSGLSNPPDSWKEIIVSPNNDVIEYNNLINGSASFRGLTIFGIVGKGDESPNETVVTWDGTTFAQTTNGISLREFPLSNIDEMREKIFAQPKTSPLTIGWTKEENGILPYSETTGQSDTEGGQVTNESNLNSFYTMSGLGIKTYQSDRFNNWLSSEWVERINNISSVVTDTGSFTMDALNLAKKIYELENRIAISGGTYEDWLDAVYGMKTYGNAEMPVYMGGMSQEIVFDEVVSSSAASDGTRIDPLGTLGGTGQGRMSKGGKIRFEAKEHGFIMILASITPRIDYYQGNKWWTKLKTMDDIHKPQLDSIGFQELTIDEFAAWDTKVNNTGEETFHSIGKQPSWIHYQTNQNEVYGNFARENAEQWMTLTRRYQWDENGLLKDGTTYVDPTQYNYPFAYVELDSQPYWAQFGIDAKVRRIMSANQIPGFQ